MSNLKHKGRHVWKEYVSGLPIGTSERWIKMNQDGTLSKAERLATVIVGRTCVKCNLQERRLNVVAEYRE